VLFAVLRIGAIAVPMSVREQATGLGYMLKHSGAKLVVCDADLGDRLPQAPIAPALEHSVLIEPGTPCGAMPIVRRPSAEAPAPVAEDDTAIILYTSGTTGVPKGAMLAHLGICHSALHYESCMGLTSGDRAIAAVPLSHVTGIVALIAAIVRAAATLIIMPTFNAREFLELAASERMTHALMVPAMYNLCLLLPDFAAHDLGAWRIGAYGGAPMPAATIAALANADGPPLPPK
jgi:acyl-CoA synthetase (AMP-forming)/AMP-acid ligase II